MPDLDHRFDEIAPSNYRCLDCGMDSDSYNSGANLKRHRGQTCPVRLRKHQESLIPAKHQARVEGTLPPVNVAEAGQIIDDLIQQAEARGTEGSYSDPEEEPLVHAAFLLLDYICHTHGDGMTGTLRVLRDLQSRVLRLDD